MPNPTPNDQLPGNDPDLTEAERTALGEMDQDGNLIEAAAEPPPAAAPAEQPNAEAPETVAPPATAPAGGPVVFPQITPGAPRDFEAEMNELRGRQAKIAADYNEGVIDADEAEAARAALADERSALDRAWASAETMAQMQQQLADQAWQANTRAFLMLPENAAILRNADIQGMFQTAMQMATNDAAAAGTPLTDDWAILTAGRDRLFSVMGLAADAPAAPAPKPVADKPAGRAPDLTNLPPTMTGAPAAAPSGARQTAIELAESNDIEALERATAGMSESQWEDLLRSVPGAFVD